MKLIRIFLILSAFYSFNVNSKTIDKLLTITLSDEWALFRSEVLKGSNIESEFNKFQDYPLLLIAMNSNDHELVNYLIDNQMEVVNIEIFSEVIRLAFFYDDLTLADKLIAEFLPSNVDITDSLPLNYFLLSAVEKNKLEQIEYLIALGADVNEEYLGLNPLFVALEVADKEIFWFLINEGAVFSNLDARKSDIIETAVLKGDADILAYVLSSTNYAP